MLFYDYFLLPFHEVKYITNNTYSLIRCNIITNIYIYVCETQQRQIKELESMGVKFFELLLASTSSK